MNGLTCANRRSGAAPQPGEPRRGRRTNMQYGKVNERVFRFRIEAAHAGRGRVIVGIITAGIGRAGDPLDPYHAGWMRAVSCRGVEFVGDLRRSRELPLLTGLLIPDLEQSDVSAGDELASPRMSE